LKTGFFEIQNMKEDYLIAKKGKVNPHLLMRFIETELIMINPIAPHFAQYCWETHVLPVYQKSKNLPKQPHNHLINQGWPEVSRPQN